MLKTRFEDIVNVNYIGKAENPVRLNDSNGDDGILTMALREDLTLASKNPKKVLVIGIDYQQDFMPNGSLGVAGADGDVERFSRFIYNNMDAISKIVISLDTHPVHAIFFPCWWIDENDEFVKPFTLITLADIDSGKYRAVIDPIGSREYVAGLEQAGKKKLVIWPYHCIKGTTGNAIENQLGNILYFYSIAKRSPLKILVKGEKPTTERYGIFKDEYSKKDTIELEYLNMIAEYDMIIIGGEAFDYCDLTTLQQIVEFFENRPDVLRKIYILRDCMSAVDPTNKDTDAEYDRMAKQYKINVVNSTDLVLQ